MKHAQLGLADEDDGVAPHAGAWIETSSMQVPNLRVVAVAPHPGAWIETWQPVAEYGDGKVAPHAGAWIETRPYKSRSVSCQGSHPTRVRGLKPQPR